MRNISNTLCCNQTIRYGDKASAITGNNIIDNSNIQIRSNSAGSEYFSLGNNNDANDDYLNNSITLFRKIKSGNYINDNNTITIVPLPILSTTINSDLTLKSDGFAEYSILKGTSINGLNSNFNLNILQNPFHVQQRSDNVVNVSSYRSEFALLDKNNLNGTIKEWTTINNENSSYLANLFHQLKINRF